MSGLAEPGQESSSSGLKFEPFGQRAIRLGFSSPEDRDTALAEQRRRDAAGDTHLPIGMIMIEMGYLTTTQLLAILKTYEEEHRT